MNSFPDELPELTAAQRAQANAILLSNLAHALGWGRMQA